jgi:hypothetical protein
LIGVACSLPAEVKKAADVTGRCMTPFGDRGSCLTTDVEAVESVATATAKAAENTADEKIPDDHLRELFVTRHVAFINAAAGRTLNSHPANMTSRSVADRTDEVRPKIANSRRVREIGRENVVDQVCSVVRRDRKLYDRDLPQERSIRIVDRVERGHLSAGTVN